METRPVQGSGPMLAERGCGQTGRQHEPDGGEIVIAGSVGDLTAIRLGETDRQIGSLSEQGSHGPFVVTPASSEQFHVGRAALHKQLESGLMSELFRNV